MTTILDPAQMTDEEKVEAAKLLNVPLSFFDTSGKKRKASLTSPAPSLKENKQPPKTAT